MVTPFEVAKCRTRPPSVVSLLVMLGDQSGRELKPPINCQVISPETGRSMLADASAMVKSFLLTIVNDRLAEARWERLALASATRARTRPAPSRSAQHYPPQSGLVCWRLE